MLALLQLAPESLALKMKRLQLLALEMLALQPLAPHPLATVMLEPQPKDLYLNVCEGSVFLRSRAQRGLVGSLVHTWRRQAASLMGSSLAFLEVSTGTMVSSSLEVCIWDSCRQGQHSAKVFWFQGSHMFRVTKQILSWNPSKRTGTQLNTLPMIICVFHC